MRAQERARARAILVASLFLSIATFVQARTIHVPSDDYRTIQEGIDDAATGDTVLVAAGTYTGRGNRNLSFGGLGITVRSESGSSATILDIAGSPSDPGRGFAFIEGEPPEARLEGFTIENGYLAFGAGFGSGSATSSPVHELSGAGITIQFFSSPVIRDIVIRSCHSDFTGGGISVERSSNPTLVDCVVAGCSSNLQGGGISIETTSRPVLEDCVVSGNRAPRGGGIACSSNSRIEGSTIAANLATDSGGGIWCSGSATLELARVLVWDNCASGEGAAAGAAAGSGIDWSCCLVDSAMVGGAGWFEFTDSVFEDPSFCDPLDCEGAPSIEGGFGIEFESPASAELSPCGLRIGAFEPECIKAPATVVTSWGATKARFLDRSHR